MSSTSTSAMPSDSESPGTQAGPEAAPINVLIVDDDPKNLTVLETVLADASYRLVRAGSADEALLALIDREFALLILDIHMPGMNGFELAQMIKRRKKTAHVPIIFLTAYYNEDAHLLEGYDTGAVDYLYKPVNPVMLRSKVAVFAELYRKSREIVDANSVLSAEVEIRRRIEGQLRELNQTLETRVAERTKELKEHAARLQRANEALEQFAYAASHDLQEPLRNIALYSELLFQRQGAVLNPEGTMYLEIIHQGAQRMAQLISSILEYAQADSLEDPLTPANAEVILAQVLKNLSRALEESRATVSHDPLPTIPVRAVHFEQLLQNLIGNAIKYKKADEALCVQVSATLEHASWHFAVSDNGIGIDPEYHTKVFELFKRLHRRQSDHLGAGLGLAICQRIVERYGGRIWVESEAGQGATFHFTLPRLRAPSMPAIDCLDPQ